MQVVKLKRLMVNRNIPDLLRPSQQSSGIFSNASLDLPFAERKVLTDAISGKNLISFTRTSSGTYVGSDGVLKTATTNLLLRSEEIGASPWGTNVSGSVTYTANAIASPTGAVTADRVTATADFAGPNQFISAVSGLNYAFSFYIKAVTPGALDAIRMECFSGRFAQFNITTRVFSNVNAAITPSSVSVGDGWVRVQLLFTAPSTGSLAVAVYANTSSDFYLWGAQLEQSSTVGEYIPTTSTINSAPRFDHNPTTGESLGLLVEEQRTNSIRNNTMVGAVAGTPGTLPTNWTTAATTGIAINVVSTGTENGITYIDVQFVGTSTAASQTSLRFEGTATMSALASTAYTGSCHIRTVAGSLANISSVVQQLVARNSGGTNIGENIVDITSSLSVPNISRNRPTNTYTTPALTTAIQHDIRLGYNSGVAIDITLRIGLPQLEQGAFATSVIPTTGTAATRNADVASITGTNFSSWYRQDEGTVFAEVDRNTAITAATTVVSINDNTTNNRLFNFRQDSASQLTVISQTGGILDASPQVSLANTSARNKVAAAQALNNLAASANGGTAVADSSVAIPTVNQMQIGNVTNVSVYNGTIRRLVYWGQRLPNNVLQAITQ